MNLINSFNQYNPEQDIYNTSSRSFTGESFTRKSVSLTDTKDITIVTEEGDKVTISSANETNLIYLNYDSLSYDRSVSRQANHLQSEERMTTLHMEATLYNRSSNISISVEGDLNKDELKEIRDVIKRIDKLMNEAINNEGISDVNFNHLNINRFQTLSTVDANYSFEKTVVVEQSTTMSLNTYTRDGLPVSKMEEREDEINEIDKLVEKMSNIVRESNVELEKFITPLKRLFDDNMDNLKKWREKNHSKIRLTGLIKKDLIQQLKQAQKDLHL